MLRRIPMSLLLAAFVTSSSALAARTDDQAAGQATKPAAGKPAAPAPGRAAGAKPAPVPVTPADAAPLMGTWQIPLETPTGRLVANLVFRTEAGKVVAGISAPQFPEHKITDITKTGQVVTLKASTNYSGAADGVLGSSDDGVDADAQGTGPGGVVRLQQRGLSDRRHGQEEGLSGCMPEPLHVAFLGCGFITRVHSQHLKGSLSGTIVPSYASRDRGKAERIPPPVRRSDGLWQL